jgi:hypothetical protein
LSGPISRGTESSPRAGAHEEASAPLPISTSYSLVSFDIPDKFTYGRTRILTFNQITSLAYFNSQQVTEEYKIPNGFTLRKTKDYL